MLAQNPKNLLNRSGFGSLMRTLRGFQKCDSALCDMDSLLERPDTRLESLDERQQVLLSGTGSTASGRVRKHSGTAMGRGRL